MTTHTGSNRIGDGAATTLRRGPAFGLARQEIRSWERQRGRSLVLWSVAIFLATRVLCLVALVFGAHHRHRSFASTLTVFDGAYYRQIATHWYPDFVAVAPHGGRVFSPIAFFPLYSVILWIVHQTGLSLTASAVAVDTVAGAAAAAVIATTVLSWTDRRTALFAAALWCAYPLGVVLSITYAEALFAVLVAACLLALSRRHAVVAAACCALACLTRPTGVVLVLVCLAVAARHRSLRALAVAAAGTAAFVGWMAYLAVLTDNADAWAVAERRGWDGYFDGGAGDVSRAIHYLAHPTQRPGATAVAVMIIAIVILIVAGWWQPIPRRYWLLSALLFVTAIASHNTYSSVPRYMIAAFPILVPVASLLRRIPRPAAWAAVAAAALVMAGAGVYITLYSTYPP